MPLVFLPLSRISRLKSPAIMIRWLGCYVLRVRIWCWISVIKCMSSWCVGIYMFRISIGVRGLLLIRMACMYGDIVLGVGSFVIFSFVYIALGIMANIPPLACEGPEYLLCLCDVLLELLYIILYS